MPPAFSVDPPNEFLCPITQELMAEPVMDREGHNFEKESIIAWLQRNRTCPLGREPLTVDQLYANRALKQQITEWKARTNQQTTPTASPTPSPPSSRPGTQRPASALPVSRPAQASPARPVAAPAAPVNSNDPWHKFHIDQEEYDRVMCMFMTFDTDGSGQLDKRELRRLCKYMNYPNTPEDIDRMFSEMDTDRSGALDLDEFLSYMQDKRPKPEILYGLSNEKYQQIMMQFHQFDSDDSGELDRNELEQLCRAQGWNLTPQQISQMFTEIDMDRSGCIDIHEFLTYMKLNNGPRRAPTSSTAAPTGPQPMAGGYSAAYGSGIRAPVIPGNGAPPFRAGSPPRNYPQPPAAAQPSPPTPAQNVRPVQAAPPNPNAPVWAKYHMDQEEYDRVMAMFLTFDTDGSGQLDKRELRRLCKYMNYPNTPDDIDTMFREMDSDGSGALDLDEFLSYMQDKRPKPEILYGLSNEKYQQIMMQFHHFDKDDSGELDRGELEQLCRSQGWNLTPQQVTQMFNDIDTDHSNRISVHEFLTYMKFNDPRRPRAAAPPASMTPPQQQMYANHPPVAFYSSSLPSNRPVVQPTPSPQFGGHPCGGPGYASHPSLMPFAVPQHTTHF